MIHFNLNRHGAKLLAAPAVAGVLYLATRLLGAPRQVRTALFALTAGAAALSLVLVVFEGVNDVFRFRAWERERARKRRLADGRFECGMCGSRSVHESDVSCPSCGGRFRRQE